MNYPTRSYLATGLAVIALLLSIGCGSSSDSEPTPAKYQYSPPQKLSDGWEVNDAASVGFNVSLLEALINQIIGGNYPEIDGVIIVKNESLILEHYFNGYGHSQKHELQSAVKSIDSALVGLAIQNGFISSPQELIYNHLPEYHQLDWSNDKDKLTLQHLMTMQSGMECTDGTEGDCNSHILNQQANWTRYTLKQEVIHQPGTRFSYFTGLNIVAHTLLENVTNTSIDNFAVTHLFEPLGITQVTWGHSSSGEALSAEMLPRDMAKFGQLYLNQGQWNGVQIISADWIKNSTSEQVSRAQTGGEGYGFWWWRFRSNQKAVSYYAAMGAKGQYIFIFPTLDLVVVFTGNESTGRPKELLENYILKALQD
ncbi:serine hydrolase [Aliikangiella sp. G2MR2-5]|uniref:serine hydrolase domain-containing protein n=1 Tax=Aliikangiella sp. G2MR2-5 TaxID=2788943 RepID=UPI0018A8DA12|nr:serine hydrolase [Aliikangiella sp. G2MR2-5]